QCSMAGTASDRNIQYLAVPVDDDIEPHCTLGTAFTRRLRIIFMLTEPAADMGDIGYGRVVARTVGAAALFGVCRCFGGASGDCRRLFDGGQRVGRLYGYSLGDWNVGTVGIGLRCRGVGCLWRCSFG